MAEEIVELIVLKGVLAGALGPDPYTHCRVYDANEKFLRFERTPRWIEDALGTRGRDVVLRARVDAAEQKILDRSIAIRWPDFAAGRSLRHMARAQDVMPPPDSGTAKMLAEWGVPPVQWSKAIVGLLEQEGVPLSDNKPHIISIASKATPDDLTTVFRFAECAEVTAGSFSDVVRHLAIDLETLPAVIRSQAPSWVTRVDVSEMINAEGEAALRVTLVVDPDEGAVLQDGSQLEDAVSIVHEAFRGMSVTRWPYTRFVSASEAA